MLISAARRTISEASAMLREITASLMASSGSTASPHEPNPSDETAAWSGWQMDAPSPSLSG